MGKKPKTIWPEGEAQEAQAWERFKTLLKRASRPAGKEEAAPAKNKTSA